MALNNKKCLVIGANSFLAREIIISLKKNNNVTGIFHLNTNNLDSSERNLPIEDLFSLNDDFDLVFLISAHVPRNNEEDAGRLKEVNEDLSLRVSEKFKKAKIVYASTVSVYEGSSDKISELSKTNPYSSYGKSKLNGETIVKTHEKYSILRISSMYGKGMNRSTFLPQVVNSAIRNKKINLYGDGSRKQNYIHVSDVAKAFILAAQNETNGTYLAVDRVSYSNLEIASIIKNKLNNVEIEFTGEDSSVSFVYDAQATYQELNFTPKKTIEIGISELIAWQEKM